MQHKTKAKIIDFIFIAICVLALAFIRFFEEKLFYDPFLSYFKNDYLNLPFPDFKGIIKSLGAWGGDFVLAVSKNNPEEYFKDKGFPVIIPYSEMIL